MKSNMCFQDQLESWVSKKRAPSVSTKPANGPKRGQRKQVMMRHSKPLLTVSCIVKGVAGNRRYCHRRAGVGSCLRKPLLVYPFCEKTSTEKAISQKLGHEKLVRFLLSQARHVEYRSREILRRAIELSAKAAFEYSTGGAFGAVVVKDGKIVSEGMNRVVASHDPSWHAEMEAIRMACITLQSSKLTGCTLHTSAEPCPMCMATAYWAGLDKIYYSATVADALQYGNFDDSFIYKELALPPEQRTLK